MCEPRVSVPASTGTAGALRDIEAGTAMLARVGRPLKPEERGKGIEYIAVGRDPVAFAAGAGVTARSLTRIQAVNVYAGKITDWRELGGNPAPIRAIGREITDASRKAIAGTIRAFENLAFAEGVKVVHLDPQVIELLDRYPTSLGFLNQSALRACKTKIVFLTLDGAAPTADNVDNGSYPIWIEFGLIHRAGALSPAAKAFLDFIRSPEGLRVLRGNGVLPAAAGR